MPASRRYLKNLILIKTPYLTTGLFLTLTTSQKYLKSYFLLGFNHIYSHLRISVLCSLRTACTILRKLHCISHSVTLTPPSIQNIQLYLSLYLSATFDTIRLSIILSRLSSSFGVSGTAGLWLSFDLLGESQTVRFTFFIIYSKLLFWYFSSVIVRSHSFLNIRIPCLPYCSIIYCLSAVCWWNSS
jgi:hypothetical protein